MSWQFPWAWNSIGAIRNNLSDGYHFGDIISGYAGFSRDENKSLSDAANSVLGEARSEYLADREHTEMREDTAYQRAVADMRQAGLNPYTVGGSPASSSASSVGSSVITNKLQVLGYLLDLKNLDAKNRQIANNAILGFISALKK